MKTTDELLAAIAHGVTAQALTNNELVTVIEALNTAYRAGMPVITDARYDHEFMAELARRDPQHPRLARVETEPDAVFGETRVPHPQPMLSTEKAYTEADLNRFLDRIRSAAKTLGLDPEAVVLRVTVKLDGLAGRYDGKVLATRGDGLSGFDITRVLKRGLRIVGDGTGPGELVVSLSYFTQHLADTFEHPRNFMVGAVAADTLSDEADAAFRAGAAHFVLYDALPAWHGSPGALSADLSRIIADVKAQTAEYQNDGAIVEVMDAAIRSTLGATSHHHRYMIAVKERGETATAQITSLTWQTGRTGRVTPVIGITPTWLSGATISNVTAHHAGMVRSLGIAVGAVIEISRAGSVIPKLERVVLPSTHPSLCDNCPSCGTALIWESDKFLVCPNSTGCHAQRETSLTHFFAILGSADLFGPATIAKLHAAGYSTLEAIYALTDEQFRAAGFGPGQSANLVRELRRSREQPTEDWRFLAAFGIRHLGRGDSKRLLTRLPLRTLGNVAPAQIQAIPGFGELTAHAIARELQMKWPTINHLLALGFNLTDSIACASASTSVFAGKRLCFSGTMSTGDRETMQQNASANGVIIQTSVNSKTDYLVVGDSPGASKVTKAQALSIAILTEAQYLRLLEKKTTVLSV